MSLSKECFQSENDLIIKTFHGIEGRIGIFGGTFDPVHNGHLVAAQAAKRDLSLSKVIFIPAAKNPLKPSCPIASNEDRLNMLLLSLQGSIDLFVSLIEYQRKGDSYTIDTLREIQGQSHNMAELYLIVGKDNIPSFHKWREYKKILEITTLVLVDRPDSPEQPVNAGPEVPEEVLIAAQKHFVPLHMECSGRDLRRKLFAGESCEEEIPQSVCDYIKQKRLYSVGS